MPSDVYNKLLRKRGDRYDELKTMSGEELIEILDGLEPFHGMEARDAETAIANTIVDLELPIPDYWH